MREDFDGVELMASTDLPAESGGEVGQLSMLAGLSNDRGNLQFAAEYFDRRRVVTGDRDWAHCLRAIEQLDDGRTGTVCRSGFPDNISITPLGPVFFTEGQTDVGIPNWSTGAVLPPPTGPLVQDPANPLARFAFTDLYTDQTERRNADLVSEIERFSAIVTGKLSLDWWSGEEAYFEAMFLNSQVFSKATAEQFFPAVPGQIPREDTNGNFIVDATGAPILEDNPLNPVPLDFQPIITLDSVPQNRDVERQQSRFVFGLRGDMGDSSWTWDAFVSYDRGIGFQAQPVLFEPHLLQSIFNVRFDSDGQLTCDFRGGTPVFGVGFPDAATLCAARFQQS